MNSVMREAGAILVDGVQVASTLQCCHCGGHFEVVKGSGTRRGFCLKCGSVTCGDAGCDPCYPVEKRFDDWEKRNR